MSFLRGLLSSSMTSSVIILAALAAFLAALFHLMAPKYSSKEPPPLPHILPFFGHAIPFVRDQRGFFEWANKKAKGNPFSMLVAGDKLYIFHRSEDVSQLFRKPSILRETRTDQKAFRLNILGFKEEDADKIAELREIERQIHNKHLLGAESLDALTVRFLQVLDLQMNKLENEITESGLDDIHRYDAFNFVGETMMRATVLAFFGGDSFDIYTNLFIDFREFLSDRFFQRLIGMPNFFARRAVGARERIKDRLGEVLRTIENSKDTSDYIQARAKELGDLGLSASGVISNEFDIIIGSNLNSIPIAYITLLHLISDPSLLASIRTELHKTRFQDESPSHRAKLVPNGLPRLHALLREVMRYHTTAWSAREVAEDITIKLKNGDNHIKPRSYELKKDSIVAMPSSLLHHDPTVHRTPERFDPMRFLNKDLGGMGTPATSATLRPFGGGVSYCPGRLFAEKQVMGYLATLCSRLNFENLETDWKIPKNSDFFFVTKCPQIEFRVLKRIQRKDP